MKYQSVIGLEIHVELNTKTKMFCRCSATYFGENANSHTCPVCLGLPGALPYINKQAIENCLKIGLALNCEVAENSLFERKNYFYPDLPKGYQISQYRWPLCKDGWLELEDEKQSKVRIRINRVHQEEDTGKLIHDGNKVLVDFNRSGVPLVEIVTEPDFTSPAQVKEFAKKLQQLFRYLGVSNADMERGDMRLEANVSVRPEHAEELPNYRIELKNINSFKFMEEALNYEIDRQIKALETGEKLTQETRGWNQEKKKTVLQRSKEEAHDYRYFPEPDLPPLKNTPGETDDIKKELPELPWDKERRFVSELGIKPADAKTLTYSVELAAFFEDVLEHGKKHGVEPQVIANYLVNKKPNIREILPAQVIEEIISKKVGIIDDEGQLEEFAKQAIKNSPAAVRDYKNGKQAAIAVLIGSVMKLTFDKADTAKVKSILEKLLEG